MHADTAIATRFLAAHPPDGTVLMCAITGSHLYGFPSIDSDVDIKGIHQAPTTQFLGLSAPRDAHDRLEVFEGVECDLTTHEVGRALALLLKGNGNILERLTSPMQLVESEELHAMRALIPAALSKAVFAHYSGYFRGMQREHLKNRRTKSLLYSFRVALTGVHLLRTSEVQAHLPTLAESYGFPELLPLIAHKRKAERLPMTPEQSEPFEARWRELGALLARSRDESSLPGTPSGRHKVDEWLIGTRRRGLGSRPPPPE